MGDPKMFPGQRRCLVHLASSESPPRCAHKTSKRRCPGGGWTTSTDSCQCGGAAAPLRAPSGWRSSSLLSTSVRAETGAHFSPLCAGSHSFGHMTSGEGWNVDEPVNFYFQFNSFFTTTARNNSLITENEASIHQSTSLSVLPSHEQDAKILQRQVEKFISKQIRWNKTKSKIIHLQIRGCNVLTLNVWTQN